MSQPIPDYPFLSKEGNRLYRNTLTKETSLEELEAELSNPRTTLSANDRLWFKRVTAVLGEDIHGHEAALREIIANSSDAIMREAGIAELWALSARNRVLLPQSLIGEVERGLVALNLAREELASRGVDGPLSLWADATTASATVLLGLLGSSEITEAALRSEASRMESILEESAQLLLGSIRGMSGPKGGMAPE